jgi:hypothetical protein
MFIQTWADTLVQPKQWKRNIFVTLNVRGLYRAGSLTAAFRELARYELDLVGVQEVRWGKGGKERAEDNNFFYGREKENH